MRIKSLCMTVMLALLCMFTACAQEDAQTVPAGSAGTRQSAPNEQEEEAKVQQESENVPAVTNLDADEIVEALKGYRSYVKGESVNYFLTDEEREEKLRPLAPVLEQAVQTGEDALLQYGPTLECLYFLVGDRERCLELRGDLYAATGDVRYQPEEHEADGRLYNEFGQPVCIYGNGGDQPDRILEYDERGRRTAFGGPSQKDGFYKDDYLTYTYDKNGRAVSIITDGVEIFFEYDGDTVSYHSQYGGSDIYHINEYGAIVSVDQTPDTP